MPTATPFTALGAGNGFPQWGAFDFDVPEPFPWIDGSGCLEKLNVSTFAHVAPMTLAQASKMFWNLHKVAGTASAVINAGTPDEETISLNMDDAIGMTPWSQDDPDSYLLDGAPATEPKDRACNRITITNPDASFFPEEDFVSYYQAALPNESFVPPEDNDVYILISIEPPTRYYNGSIHDEDKFIGYGFGNGWALAESFAEGNAAGYASSVETTLDVGSAQGTWAANTVSGIPVLEFTQTSATNPNANATLGDFVFYDY
jgi:hypothetical protein